MAVIEPNETLIAATDTHRLVKTDETTRDILAFGKPAPLYLVKWEWRILRRQESEPSGWRCICRILVEQPKSPDRKAIVSVVSGRDRHSPILLSDSQAMLWIADCLARLASESALEFGESEIVTVKDGSKNVVAKGA